MEYTDPEDLRELHVERGMSFEQVAEFFDINVKTARRHIKTKIGVHPQSMDRPLIYVEDETLEKLYWDREMTQEEIANIYSISKEAVQSYMDRNDIDVDTNRYPDKLSESHKENISESNTGHTKGTEWRENLSESMSGHTKDKEWRENLSKSLQNSGDLENHNELYRSPYQFVRKNVIQRDNNSCVECGSSNSLVVHHIVPVRLFKKWDRATVSDAHVERNMVTLCHDCHMDRHK
jgi:5-methylcytosine-specific restriction endonuclease McrA/DNA-binding CsgD family transcriptional regulator